MPLERLSVKRPVFHNSPVVVRVLGGDGFDLGDGHGAVEYKAPWGRPVAQWIPMWGEEGRAEIDSIRAIGEDR